MEGVFHGQANLPQIGLVPQILPQAGRPDTGQKRSASADLSRAVRQQGVSESGQADAAQRQRGVAVAGDRTLRAQPRRSQGAGALLQRAHQASCSGLDGRHAEAGEKSVCRPERRPRAVPRHRARAALGARRRRSPHLLRHQLSLALRLQGHHPRRIRIGRHHRADGTSSPQAMWSTGRPRAA